MIYLYTIYLFSRRCERFAPKSAPRTKNTPPTCAVLDPPPYLCAAQFWAGAVPRGRARAQRFAQGGSATGARSTVILVATLAFCTTPRGTHAIDGYCFSESISSPDATQPFLPAATAGWLDVLPQPRQPLKNTARVAVGPP